MGRRSITGGVMAAGSDRIQFDMHINGRRLRPTLPCAPTEENLQRAREHLYEQRLLATTAADLEALLPWSVKPLLKSAAASKA